MRACRARAMRLAGTQCPRSGIEKERSSSRAAARLPRLVAARRIGVQVLEHAHECPLADAPGPPGRQLEAALVALHDARLLERLLDLLQAPHVGDGLLAEGPAQPLLVDVVDR